MKITPRVKEILSWYSSDSPGTLTNLARLLGSREARRNRQARHPAGRPGLRARPRPLLRPEPGRLRPRLPLPARHRRRMQRLRGAARLPRGRSREVRRPDPAHPQAQQLRQRSPRSTSPSRPSPARSTTRCASAASRSATPSIRAPAARNRHVRGSPRASPRKPSARGSRWWCGATRAGRASPRTGETAVDVVAYAAQIAAQLGAHIIKVKPPKDLIEQAEAKKVFEK